MSVAFSQTFPLDEAAGYVKRDVGQAAVTATGFIGTQLDQLAASATDMALVLNIEAIDLASTDESYTFRIVGSNLANRSDGQVLATVRAGVAATPETRASAVGDRLIALFRTEFNRTFFRYVDLHLTVGGTTPSITFNAYLTRPAT